MKYIVCDDFIYRRAEFSIDSFFDFLNNVSNEEILKKANNEYREVLYSLSSNLLKSLANVNMDKEKLCIALYKYISRCSSRATPYALSATVGLGEFSEQQNFNISKRFKHDNILVDVDGRWAFDVMRIMEEKLFDDLKIKVNNTLRFHEKDIVNIWVTNEDNSNIYKNNLVINRTKALDIIISAAKDETTIHKLLEKLSNEYPNVNNTVFINFLHELINSEILISDIRISLLEPNIINNLAKVLKKYHVFEESKKIIEINEICQNFNCNTERNFIEKADMLIGKMKDICISKKYLNIINKSHDCLHIPHKSKKEISDFITFITKISELLPKPLNNYKNQFVDRYGFNLAVPILDVFYDKKLLFDDDERLVRENQLYKSLMRKISNGNINSIIDISYLVSKYDYKPKRYHSGIEMSFYLLNNNDCFEYIISPLVGSDAIGRSFGRFDFYFDNKMSKRRNQILSTSPQYETVDLTFFPKEKTLLNVMNGPKSSEMQFKFGSNDFEENLNIQFDDIYIYLDSDGDFHFFDINSEKEIIFNVNNMVNLNYAPEIVRYIMALRSKSEPQVFDIFHVLNAIGTDLGFLPKITYKNFTITPKKKYIFKDLDNFYKVGLEKGLEKRIIQELLNCFPSGRFFLENGDNRIIVDIKTDIGQKIAIKELVNNQCLLASDIPFKAECLPINDGNNSYVGEFVFQIYSSNEQKVRQNNFEIMNTRPSEYSYLPFDKYLYYKIYCSRQNQNRLLQIEISPWVSKLKEEGLIKGFFYVKYKDEKDHLRLRFILNESTNIEKLTSINLNFLKQYEKKELIDDVTMNIYEREVYRYGGKDQLDELENIFSIESEVFLKSINCLSYTEKNFLFFNIVLYYLGISGVSSEEIVDMLKVYKMKKEHRKEFLIFFDENNNEKISHNIEQILKEFKYYEEEIAIALNRVRMHNSSEKRNEIYLSIFHMLHNRLIGIDRENENKIMSFTNREYRIAYEKKKGGQNNG